MIVMNQMIKIFIVEDDEIFSEIIRERLEMEGIYEVTVFETAKDCMQELYQHPDIVIIDYNLPEGDGIQLLKAVKNYEKSIASVLLSGQQEIQVVVDAYNNGAKRYIMKGNNAIVELMYSLEDIKQNLLLKKEVENLKEQVITANRYENIIGESAQMLKVFHLMRKVENVNISVLVTGQSGTGKELVASALHYNSERKRKPFVAVNVAAIPEDLIESELFGHEKGAFTGANQKRIGMFEQADRGTIFLDEIGELDINMQSKLLRVLQERKVTRLGGSKEINLDIRVITATNKNLWEEVQKGKFREDLYFRLQGFMIHLPPLQDRGNDILLLAKYFANKFCKQQKVVSKQFNSEAIKTMLTYSWPGNIRELKSMMERAILISESDKIMADDLIFLEQQPLVGVENRG